MAVKQLDAAVEIPIELVGGQPNADRKRGIAVALGKICAQDNALLSLIGSLPVGEEEEFVLDDRTAELVDDRIAGIGKRRRLIVETRAKVLISPEEESAAVELIASTARENAHRAGSSE